MMLQAYREDRLEKEKKPLLLSGASAKYGTAAFATSAHEDDDIGGKRSEDGGADFIQGGCACGMVLTFKCGSCMDRF